MDNCAYQAEHPAFGGVGLAEEIIVVAAQGLAVASDLFGGRGNSRYLVLTGNSNGIIMIMINMIKPFQGKEKKARGRANSMGPKRPREGSSHVVQFGS